MANGGGKASRKRLIGSARNAVFWLHQSLIRICSVKNGINLKGIAILKKIKSIIFQMEFTE
jgi:hypothetical protein